SPRPTRPARHETSILAQGGTGHELRRYSSSLQHAQCGDRTSQYGGLSVGREPQLIFRTLETKAGYAHAERVVRLVESAPGRGLRVVKRPPHAHSLRALSGKKERHLHRNSDRVA